MKRVLLSLFVFVAICFAVHAQEAVAKKNPWAFEPDPNLPDVLILGDSISIGYTVPVRKLLEGKANVWRPMNAKGDGPENCGNTKMGLKNIDRFLDEKRLDGRKWAVIQFNWGLWDVTYRNPQNQDNKGERDKVKGGVSFTPEQYGENLEKLVERLKKTGAKLIWANISYIPDGEAARVMGDDAKYNAVAAAIMKKHGIPINDIYGLTSKMEPKLFAGPGDVHYKPEGSKIIAEQTAEIIEKRLAEKSE